jgi:hypothetical protein
MRKINNMKDTNKYSSYWIGSDLFDDDDDIIVDKHAKKSNDLMALASYKRAIGNFVSIVTNENIKVMFDQRGDNLILMVKLLLFQLRWIRYGI